jgi:thiol-disulfide isomerase/thioredoxin
VQPDGQVDAQSVRKPVALCRLALGLALALGVAACGAPRAAPVRSAPSSTSTSTPASGGAKPEVVPFIEDDWARALAEAKAQKKPVFVDAWATWCHSCQSMRAYVLTDPALAPLAKDFVWLTVDTDRESNGAFVKRFPNDVWPTLWVIDAESEAPLLKWGGTATAPELVTLLGAARGGGGEGARSIAFLRGVHAAARGELVEAEKAYRDALASPGPEYARAAEALVALLSSKDDHGACAEAAERLGPGLPAGTSRASVLATGLACAREGRLRDRTSRLRDAARKVVDDPDPRMIADDRSALFEELVETAKAEGDAVAARDMASRWALFLEAEAGRAATPQARAVYDAHRLSAYLALGDPARALPMLEQSERDFPEDFNAPARLARAFLELRALDKAHAAVGRAAARVYGPRVLRVSALAADIARARGDGAGERAALERALGRTANAVLSPGQKALRAGLERRLRELREARELR